LRFIVDDCRPRVLVYEDDFAESAAVLDVPVKLRLGDDFESAKAGADPSRIGPVTATHDDPWAILYTSGTTGHPKGALVTHGMFFWNAINIGHAVGLTSASTNLNVLPTFHSGGLNLYTTPCLHLGARSVNLREFDPGRVLHWLESGEITHFFGVPAVYQFLAEAPGWQDANLTHVVSWACGGAPMPVALLERYAGRGIVIRQGMGLTETSPTVFLTDAEHAMSKAGSVGKPALHTEIRIVDPAGNDVGVDEVGELWVRGPNVTPGYWERPEANEESFTDGWLHTGDAARRDADGYVFIVDRWKDMYISGGENVYPAEVEQVLFHHPNVLDVAVIGVQDDRWGEVGMAVIVPRDPAACDDSDYLAFCNDKLARFKIPKRVALTDELPRNAAGKVLKRELQDTMT
jgi:fatty-acyl-CoA synthase